MSDAPKAHWVVLAERELLRVGGRLTVSQQRVRLPDGREVEDYLQFSSQSYVCIFALTPEGLVLCEQHYKHGPGRVILSLPAGACEGHEEPLVAAQRELLEETGHASSNWELLGEGLTHANAGGGRFHMYLARDCRKIAEPDSGDLEDITIQLMAIPALLQAVGRGDMPVSSDPATILHALKALDRL